MVTIFSDKASEEIAAAFVTPLRAGVYENAIDKPIGDYSIVINAK
jgi:hypothetical protein